MGAKSLSNGVYAKFTITNPTRNGTNLRCYYHNILTIASTGLHRVYIKLDNKDEIFN